MGKKEYQKPRMMVVEINNRDCLLTGSPTRTGYTLKYDDEDVETINDTSWDR